MEEEHDDSTLGKFPQDDIDKVFEELRTERELKFKWQKELEENKAFQTYLEGFYSTPSESTIKQYVSKKYLWHRFGDDIAKEII